MMDDLRQTVITRLIQAIEDGNLEPGVEWAVRVAVRLLKGEKE